MIDPELSEEAPAVDPKTLRQFAGLWILIFSAAAAWHVHGGHNGRAVVEAVLALLVGPRGLIAPESMRPLFMALVAVTRPIGVFFTRIVLGVLYFGIFTPLGLVFRLFRRDALRLKRDPQRTTYRVARNPTTAARRYLRQF